MIVYVGGGGGGWGGEGEGRGQSGYDSFATPSTFNHQSHKICSAACTLSIIRVNDKSFRC